MTRSPPLPRAMTFASSATSATARSDGCVAMHLSLVPSIAKIPAASALHDVAAHRRHVAQLTRRGKQQRLTDNRISVAHTSVPRNVAHVCKRAESQAAVWQLADTREIGIFSERVDVDEMLRSLDVELHKIYESSAARD